jgi:cell division protein FtsI (penicillin-binding protein 3)
VELLADGVGVPFADLWRALMVDPNAAQVLRRGLTAAEREQIKATMRRVPYSGLSIKQEFQRVYPNGAVLAHVIGLQGDRGDPRTTADDQPSTGFEKGLDELLRGKDGIRRTIAVSSKFGVNPALDKLDAEPGHSVRTSLDLSLSSYAHGQLVQLQEEHQPWRCFAIAVDVDNGQILTMLGLPDYDPNDPMATITERQNPYSGRTEHVGWINPAQWHFEPGSSFKPLVAAYALHRGAIGPQQLFESHGGNYWPPPSFSVRCCRYRCALRTHRKR